MKTNSRNTLTRDKFKSDDDCLAYIAKIKWPSILNFTCIKCNHKSYCKGEKPYSRQCLKCGYDESPTANTSFHNFRSPFLEVFGCVEDMAMQLYLDFAHFKTEWIGRDVNRSKTKHSIRRRIQTALQHDGITLTNSVYLVAEKLSNILKLYNGDEYLLFAAEVDLDNDYYYSLSAAQIVKKVSESTLTHFCSTYIDKGAFLNIYHEEEFDAILQTHGDTMFYNPSDLNPDNYSTLPYLKNRLIGWLLALNYRMNVDTIAGAVAEFIFLSNRYNNCEDPFDELLPTYFAILQLMASRKLEVP